MATAEVLPTQAFDTITRELATDIAAFTEVRPRLFAIAFRILQSAAEAEDVVQDAWLRWQQTNRSVVLDVPAFLATTTTRLCLNIAQSARWRRETFDSPWLPELIETRANPELGAIRNAGLEHAIAMLLERLSPPERAAYILREAFDYSYSQIAEVLRIAEANSRQLVVRARKHLAEGRRSSVISVEKTRLLDAFIQAAQIGDLSALENVLARDAAAFAGASRSAALTQFRAVGPNRIQKFVATMSSKLWNGGTLCVDPS
ncbi:sigma-70 family RNA polymerase sigma factor [Occallatibacter riparius]|uniref:Sigma-70 family RNA polymerase sigma factor n=1 Tax=Occallatibacter riparius TaxID=1002689 RepID=A0A9J7BNS7_9BACT|nr:sigma-70 family RNA polymerase sigma factor [Occallatibacter riparius]UWZ84387.1 sigma-70 family RNA polymerase sigma factor [Occallatibacter riparius]